MPRFWKKINVQMRLHISRGSDTTAMLIFLRKLMEACNLSHFSESIAVWCFQLYAKEQVDSLLLTQRTGSSMAMDSKPSQLSRTNGDVVSFLIQTYGTDEVIVEA